MLTDGVGLNLLATSALGLTVVLGGLLAFFVSDRAQAPLVVAKDGPELPDGVVEVLSTLRSAAVVLDVADDVVRATPAAYATGLARGRAIPHAEVMALVGAVRRDGAIRDVEVQLPRGPVGQGWAWLQVRVAPLGSLHVLVLAEDRSEALRIEETRRDFTANVSHELKTPVGAISLLSETIDQAADDPEAVRHFAKRMHTEAARLSRLVQEIIDLSRVQGAPGQVEPIEVDIDGLVSEAVDRARVAAEAKQIQIQQGSPSAAVVYGDRGLLLTAVSNLIENAVRYSEPDTRIGVGVGVKTTGSLVEIAVADQGIGIAAADLDRVFERFYRVDPARSRATGGTGLGLSIVKHVANNHGGEVTVWSQLGQGSTFTLRLPTVAHVERDQPVELPPPSAVRRLGRSRGAASALRAASTAMAGLEESRPVADRTSIVDRMTGADRADRRSE